METPRPQKASRPGWDHLPLGWLLSTYFVDLVGMVGHVLSEPLWFWRQANRMRLPLGGPLCPSSRENQGSHLTELR